MNKRIRLLVALVGGVAFTHAHAQDRFAVVAERQRTFVERGEISWQNVGCNQPPHPGFYPGDGMKPPPHPNITPAGKR